MVICEPFFFPTWYIRRGFSCVFGQRALLLCTFEGSRSLLNSVVLGVILVTDDYFGSQITRESRKSLGPTEIPPESGNFESSTSSFIHECHKDMRGWWCVYVG